MAEFGRVRKLHHAPQDGDHEGRQEVRDTDVGHGHEVRADGEDEDAAHIAEVAECGVRHERLDRARCEKDRPLEDADGDRGEDAALPEGTRR